MAEGQSTLAMDDEPEDDERVGMTVYGNENTDGSKEGSNIDPKLGELGHGKEPDRATVNMAVPLDDASFEDLNENLSLEIEEKIEALRDRGRPVNILVIGGFGKTTLINAMCGVDVVKARVGARRVIPGYLHPYKGEYSGVRIKVYDTPGCYGGKGYSDILSNSNKHSKYDLILICTKLVDRVDQDMFSELASHLQEEMWKRTVVVLTFANHFIECKGIKKSNDIESLMKVQINEHKSRVVESFSKSISKEVLEGIPFCLAGLKDERELPTVDDWLKELWETCIDHCSDEPHALLKEPLCVIS